MNLTPIFWALSKPKVSIIYVILWTLSYSLRKARLRKINELSPLKAENFFIEIFYLLVLSIQSKTLLQIFQKSFLLWPAASITSSEIFLKAKTFERKLWKLRFYLNDFCWNIKFPKGKSLQYENVTKYSFSNVNPLPKCPKNFREKLLLQGLRTCNYI